MVYMTDPRHAPDTFFIVAEADWRLREAHCVGHRQWVAEVDEFAKHFLLGEHNVDSRQGVSPAAPVMPQYMNKTSGEDEDVADAPWATANSSGMAGPSARSSGMAGPPRPERPGGPAPSPVTPPKLEKDASFYGWVKSSRPDTPVAYISRDLRDLIRIANQASRYEGRGDLVWYSWCGEGWEKTSLPMERPCWVSAARGQRIA